MKRNERKVQKIKASQYEMKYMFHRTVPGSVTTLTELVDTHSVMLSLSSK